MKKNNWIILSILSLVAVGCADNTQKETTGVVIDAMKDNVVIFSENDTLIFSIKDAEKDAPDGLDKGDSITLYHIGEAPTAQVSKIVITRPEALKEKQIKGIVIDGTMNTVMVGVGKDTISFSTENAEKDTPDGMLIGDSITVFYKNSDQNNGFPSADKIVIPARTEKKE
ncbi:MAG: hypothetical protein PHD21_01290 [Flavobacteriales bacterium]|nr:hypothetical protein [Flavobacteriales bacterium]